MSGLNYRSVSGHRIKPSAVQKDRHIPEGDRQVYDDKGKLVSNKYYKAVSGLASKNKTTYTKVDKAIEESTNPFSKSNIKMVKKRMMKPK